MAHQDDTLGRRSRGDSVLRVMDLALAVAAAPAAALLTAAGLAAGARLERSASLGAGGRPFTRLALVPPPGRIGRLLTRLGAADAPALCNVIAGTMAWVGPAPRSAGEGDAPGVRPGLIGPDFVSRRTAVDFEDPETTERRYLRARGPLHDLGLLARALVVALLPQPARTAPARVQVADVTFDNVTMEEALDRIERLLDDRGTAHQVSFVNPACVNIAARMRAYRRVLHRAALVLPDGIGVKIAADLLGTPLRQNVNGTDLFPRLASRLERRGASVYLLGGRPGVAARVAEEMATRWPGVRIAGFEHGYFGAGEEGEVVARIRASAADVLLVARGVPGQELFIDRHLPGLGVSVALGVGGLFDFVAGRIPRAPRWMRESGLEWTWRLAQEPGRMWRRYLIGNFSFLGRVLMQRLGWRRPAADLDVVSPQDAAARGAPATRAVVFATTRAGSGLPVPHDYPAALLPLGCATPLERALALLTASGIREVMIVASDRPEALRSRVGDGERWGLQIRWQLVRDPALPYAALETPWVRAAQRVVVGHAERAAPRGLVERLCAADAVVLQFEGDGGPDPRWSGWASTSTAILDGLPDASDFDRIGATLAVRSGAQLVVGEALAAPSLLGDGLLTAQARLLADEDGDAVPPSWIRTEWGARSPDSHVDAGATVQGPALVGPGCWIESGAVVGPGTVLSRDVIVSAGTRVENSVVFPGTYLGSGLELSATVVCGTRVSHRRLGVETAIPASDALLLPLHDHTTAAGGWAARAVAALLWLAALPWLAVHRAACAAGLARSAWQWRSVVAGCGLEAGRPAMTRLRCEVSNPTTLGRFTARLAGLGDVAAGRRAWFGARARDVDSWYALNPDWQALLAHQPVGLFHAPGWHGDPAARAEAEAAADVFLAVRRRARGHGAVLPGAGLARSLRRA